MLHNTEGPADVAIDIFQDCQRDASVTALITRSGKIVGMLPESQGPWTSSSESVDAHGLSIELEGGILPSISYSKPYFTTDQHEATLRLMKFWMSKYNITPDNIINHRYVLEKYVDPNHQ